MSQLWIEKLRAAPTRAERDHILLRELRDGRRTHHEKERERCYDEVEEQLRALADLAFGQDR